MAITHSDRISGTIYIIATDSETAQRMALRYLHDRNENHDVFDLQADASEMLRDAFRPHEARERVYAFSLDIRVTDEK